MKPGDFPLDSLTPQRWECINRRLVARMLAEFTYEGLLDAAASGGYHNIQLGAVSYRFTAARGLWGQLRIDPASVARQPAAGPMRVTVLMTDLATALNLDGATTGNWLQELQHTLLADLQIDTRRAGIRLAELDDIEQQVLLLGHPKLVASKGRIGWGLDELAHLSPEAGKAIQLHWVAVTRALASEAPGNRVDDWGLPYDWLDECDWSELTRRASATGAAPERHRLLPVHPWQWQRWVVPLYADALASGELISLGSAGPALRPLLSLRTFADARAPARARIKLPLSIRNTSCYRGLPGEAIKAGVGLSAWLDTLCRNDPALYPRLRVQRELAAVHVRHAAYESLAGAPYRFCETLGAAWREAPAAHLAAGERTVLLATLAEYETDGTPVLAHWCREAGCSVETWISALFRNVTAPLYQLLCAHGVGFIAHGQNVAVILQQSFPAGALIKDFHGDLRLAEDAATQGLDPNTASAVKRLPAEHLMHDLYTGHLVTALRFVGDALAASGLLSEERFYGALVRVLREHQAQHPELAAAFQRYDLLRPHMARVCVNRALIAVGYDDRAERPLPVLGPPLDNPLHTVAHTTPALETPHD